MTLEDLERDWLEARDEFFKVRQGTIGRILEDMTPEYAKAYLGVYKVVLTGTKDYETAQIFDLYNKVSIYLVARDEGMDAALLWKLAGNEV